MKYFKSRCDHYQAKYFPHIPNNLAVQVYSNIIGNIFQPLSSCPESSATFNNYQAQHYPESYHFTPIALAHNQALPVNPEEHAPLGNTRQTPEQLEGPNLARCSSVHGEGVTPIRIELLWDKTGRGLWLINLGAD